MNKMYDTIVIRKDTNDKQMKDIVKRFDNRFTTRSDSGNIIKGRINSMGIQLLNGFIRIAVSLPTLRYGHNLYSLKLSNVNDVILQMEQMVGIKLGDALVSRI